MEMRGLRFISLGRPFFISEENVKVHVKHIMDKLDANERFTLKRWRVLKAEFLKTWLPPAAGMSRRISVLGAGNVSEFLSKAPMLMRSVLYASHFLCSIYIRNCLPCWMIDQSALR